ncbi:hypothetical protein OAA91_00520 [Fibrobacterales bacterium]|nr:hypothetical protein [Fibrobacterales bacterium]
MYWTWNSGHIYFKLEGTSKVSTSPGKRVEYHLGGFRGKEKTTQEVVFDISKVASEKPIILEFDLSQLWSKEGESFCISKYSALTLQNQIQPLKARIPLLFKKNQLR